MEKKYINEKLSTTQIAKLCNVGDEAIREWMIKFGIPRRSYGEAHHLRRGNHCKLSRKAIEWINGELLGDGCLRSKSKYSASITYTSKYLEYIKYIRDTLKSFGIEQAGKIYKRYHKNLDCYSYNYCSRTYAELLTIRKKWYPEGKKIIPKDIKLTSLTLRQHYIGDGCLKYTANTKNIVLYAQGFPINDVRWFVEQLLKLNFKATKTTKNVIYISTHSVKKFLKYIGICPVECYKYKWNV